MSAAIIIPSYNSAPWLEATVASALAQTQRAATVIVMDDGSTDATPEVAAKFGDAIRYVRLANGGVSRARNEGAKLAEDARWLLFLDSDDLLLPHALATLIPAAEAADAGVAYGRVLRRLEPPAEPSLHGTPLADGEPPLPARASWHRAIITTPGAAVVNRELHARVGGFVAGCEPMEDREFWVKCGMLARFKHCDSVVLDKTWRAGSAVSQQARRIRSEVRARFAFAEWCAVRGLDPVTAGFSPQGVIVAGVKDAMFLRQWEPLRELLAEARTRGVRSPWLWWARLKLLGKPTQ